MLYRIGLDIGLLGVATVSGLQKREEKKKTVIVKG